MNAPSCTCTDKPQWCDFCLKQIAAQKDAWLAAQSLSPAGVEPPFAAEQPRGLVPQGGKGGHDFSDGKNCQKCGASFGKWALGSVGNCEAPPPPRAADPVPVRFSEVKSDARAEGIARAVDRLSHFEPRLGAARWRP